MPNLRPRLPSQPRSGIEMKKTLHPILLAVALSALPRKPERGRQAEFKTR
jgi:hypothetical protein